MPFAAFTHAEQLYDLKDLEVLNQQKNFEEFLLHVNDIRPSERNQHWKDMFQTMSIGMIDYKIKIKDFTPKSFSQIEKIGRSSALLDDEYYQIKRTTFAKKYLTECFKNIELKTQCENDLTSFWFFSNKDPETALTLATILEVNKSNINRWPFYQVAINDRIAPLYCARPDIQKSIIQKITQESFNVNFDNNYKHILDKFIPNKCFDKLVENLRNALLSPNTNGSDKELAMHLLEAKNLLTETEQDFFAVIFLLNGPVVGDKMNLAWKKVEAFNDNFSKREKILELIKGLDIIPDEIFKDPNLPRHKAVINLLAKNFPELLNYYGKNCLEYIATKGKVSNNISSSYQCHQFLKTAKNNSQWLTDSIQTQYSALQK